MVQEISISEFKAKCFSLLDSASKNGSELVVTKRSKPLVRIVPIAQPASLFGSVK